jgi:hypothetical protein
MNVTDTQPNISWFLVINKGNLKIKQKVILLQIVTNHWLLETSFFI